MKSKKLSHENPPDRKIFDLYNYALVQKSCQVSQQYSKFFATIGNSGAGKSLALKSYAFKNNETVKYLEVGESMTSKNFFRDLARLFECQYTSLTVNASLNWINLYIKEHKKKHLLIVDEAGRFTPTQYSYIHELRNFTEDNLGIILSGPDYFIKNIQRWDNKNIEGIPEFFRRINKVIFLKDLTTDEIIGICQNYGIKSMKVINDRFINTKVIGRLITDIENYLFFDNLLFDNDKVEI